MFGNANLRVILLDCGQSWIYPAGDKPGAYALPPDAEPPPGAVLEVRARHADGDPFYDVYCVAGKGLVLEQPAGEYRLQTGAYWLDTMERWPMYDGDGVQSDRIVLTMVSVLG